MCEYEVQRCFRCTDEENEDRKRKITKECPGTIHDPDDNNTGVVDVEDCGNYSTPPLISGSSVIDTDGSEE
jgi:hypothetical protein